MTIDELEGVKLAEAVAEARGWKNHSGLWWKNGTEQSIEMVRDYRPDRDIAQSFELDESGWLWDRWEFHNGYDDNGPIVGLATNVHVPGVDDTIKVRLNINDFPTKANAYATARCRAFLKAKEALDG